MTKPVNKPKPQQKTISEVIALHAHDPHTNNGGGILATCVCGEAYDWMPNHLQEHILRECFPHLSSVHEDLIRKEPSIFLTKHYYMNRHKDTETLLTALWDFVDRCSKKTPDAIAGTKKQWFKGHRAAAKRLKQLLIEHDM